MTAMRARLVACSAVGLLVAACGAASSSARVSSRPVPGTVSAAPANDFRCENLAHRGITPCPPAGIALEPIVIRNGTNGAVDDVTARLAGQGYLRAHALYDWAVRQEGADPFLASGA